MTKYNLALLYSNPYTMELSFDQALLNLTGQFSVMMRCRMWTFLADLKSNIGNYIVKILVLLTIKL